MSETSLKESFEPSSLLLAVNSRRKAGMRGGKKTQPHWSPGERGMRNFLGTGRAGEASRRRKVSERVLRKGRSAGAALGVKRIP